MVQDLVQIAKTEYNNLTKQLTEIENIILILRLNYTLQNNP